LGFQHFTVRAIPPLVAQNQYRAVTGLVIYAFSVTSGLALLAMLTVSIFFEYVQPYTDPAMTNAIVAAGLLFLPLTINQVRQGVQRGLGRPLDAQLPDFVIQPMFFIILISLTAALDSQLDAVRAIKLTLISSLIGLGIGIYFLASSARGRFHWPPKFMPLSWIFQAGSSFYLFAATAVMSATDLLMLGYLSDAQETGIYGVAVRFHALMLLPSLAVSAVLSHEVSRMNSLGMKTELEIMARRSATSAAYIALAIAVCSTIATFHLEKIFGADFRIAALPILILVWSRAAETMLGQPGVILANATFVGPCGMIVTFATCLNVVLNILLIPRSGATGAAIATAIAHVVMVILFTVLTRLKVGIVTLPYVKLPLFLLAAYRRNRDGDV
jgi:O-antigen/teichoic acid export membrane protein